MTLCVDLDGTLVKTDVLLESAVILLKRKPWLAPMLPVWALRGPRVLKDELARRVEINPAALPYREDLLAYLREERARGRRLVLATASHQSVAEKISAHVGIFAHTLGTTREVNCAGSHKAKRIQALLGEEPFGYAGDRPVDLLVWKHAQEAICVNAPASLVREAGKLTQVTRVFPEQGTKAPPMIKHILKAMRPHQWVKNFLIFLPLVAAHRVFDLAAWSQSVLAFLSFGLCASSVYVLNDLADLEADRAHPTKRKRPFASGDLPLHFGLAMVPLLLAAAGALAYVVSPDFVLVLAVYFAATTAYSFKLKQVALLDVVVLASLYTIRVVAGGVATGIPVSQWLLAFSMFLFLSLALMKRYSELHELKERAKDKIKGRGYSVEDLSPVGSMGTASGFLSVLVFALYVNHPAVTNLYPHPERLWLACPLIFYWIGKVWLATYRGKMNDDPIVFAIKDPATYAVGAFVGAVLWMAS